MAHLKTNAFLFLSALLMAAIFLVFSSGPAEAKKCGGKNQEPCPFWQSGPVCNEGLGDFDGKCKPCGKAGQRSCPPMTRGPQCEYGLEKQNGKCVRCGGKDQLACSWLQPGRRCKAGLGKFGDYCRPCGKDGQQACPALEQGAPCEQGLREIDGKCVGCGGNGQRICRVIDKGPACKSGLQINFLTQTCEPESKSDKESAFEQYRNNKGHFDARHAKLTRALTTVTEDGPPLGEGGRRDGEIDVDDIDSIYIGGDDQSRREMMMRYLEDDAVVVVTLMTGGSGSIGVGYGYASGWAMKARGGPGQPFIDNASVYECRAIKTHSFSAGLSAGLSGTVEIGEWNDGFDQVAGKSHGVQAMATVLAAGWGAGAHFGRDGGATGATVINGGSVGAELTPVEYIHGWTEVEDEETNCDDITW